MPLVYDATINRIILNSPYGRYEEAVAAGTIKPGMLVEYDANLKVVVNNNATTAWSERTIAKENALLGKSVEDNYASGDIVQVHFLQPGDVFYGYVLAATAITILDILAGNGDGTFKTANAATDKATAIALETKAAGANDTLVKMRAL